MALFKMIKLMLLYNQNFCEHCIETFSMPNLKIDISLVSNSKKLDKKLMLASNFMLIQEL